MSDDRKTSPIPEDLEDALALYYEGAIKLEGLGWLMAECATRRARGESMPSVRTVAAQLSVLVHEHQTVMAMDKELPSPGPVDPMTIQLGQDVPSSEGPSIPAHGMHTADVPAVPDNDDAEEPRTVVFGDAADQVASGLRPSTKEVTGQGTPHSR